MNSALSFHSFSLLANAKTSTTKKQNLKYNNSNK